MCSSCADYPGRCTSCHGAGGSLTGRDCPTCNGTGRCHYCGGAERGMGLDGVNECLNCRGSGTTLTGQPCVMCYGSGRAGTGNADMADELEPVVRFGGWAKAMLKAIWGGGKT